ncbi:unnamed protein product, partial [Owenia fusiformis]
EPDHHCKLDYINDIDEIENRSGDTLIYKNITRKGQYIPIETVGGQETLSSCRMYSRSLNNLTSNGSSPNVHVVAISNISVPCANGWSYDYSIYGETIITEWDLVCEKITFTSTSQMVVTIGMFIGGVLNSFVSDKFGRKPVFFICAIMLGIVGVICSFSQSFLMFMLLRFAIGIFQQGTLLSGSILMLELFPSELRTIGGTVASGAWGLAMASLALLAYVIRNWRYLQLVISLVSLLVLPFFWFLKESIPWLVANGKTSEALEVLKRAAKFNKRHFKIEDSLKDSPLVPNNNAPLEYNINMHGDSDCDSYKTPNADIPKAKTDKTKPKDPMAAKINISAFFLHPMIRRYTFIFWAMWFVNSLVYYGLSLSTSSLNGDPYVNFALTGLVEVPAVILTMVAMLKFGRKRPVIVLHWIAGVALFISPFLTTHDKDSGAALSAIKTIVVMLGKAAITGSFTIIWLYAPEVYPTNIRNIGVGASACFSRLGGVLAPYSALVIKVFPLFPGVCFGVLTILVGFLALFLPETHNQPLPQTLEDVDELAMVNKSTPSCCCRKK